MTETSTDRRALLLAIASEPDDDTVRLAFADWLEENPLPGTCPNPTCGNPAKGWDGFYQCRTCRGSGTVPDDMHARHAELIRVSCHRARMDRVSMEYAEVVAREAELVDDLRARLMPRCPAEPHGCGGEKFTPCHICGANKGQRHSGHCSARGDHRCPLCSGSGVCPGTLVRGMPRCEVPLAAVGRESNPRCENAAHWGNYTHGSWTPNKNCGECKGAGSLFVFRSTPWAIAAKSAGASFQPSDKVPHETHKLDGQLGFDYEWIREQPNRYVDRHTLPQTVFDRLERDRFPTEPAAHAALSRATTSLVPATTPEEGQP